MRINSIGQLFSPELRKTDGAKKSEPAKTKSSSSDSAQLSSGGQRLSATQAETAIVSAQVAVQPDVRTDRVAEVKKRIQDGFYNTPEFVDKLADKLAQEFGAKKS
jgi:flagellar biosynthesis anti-sigma factor FlgM